MYCAFVALFSPELLMKRMTQALSVAALLYGLFLLFDARRSGVSSESSLPPHASLELPLQTAGALSHEAPVATPLREFRPRSSGHSLRQSAQRQRLPQVQSQQLAAVPVTGAELYVEKLTPPIQLEPKPLARNWEVQELRSRPENCPPDRDCKPLGRDGVLMMGSNFAVNNPRGQYQGNWNVGSAIDQNPLLYTK